MREKATETRRRKEIFSGTALDAASADPSVSSWLVCMSLRK